MKSVLKIELENWYPSDPQTREEFYKARYAVRRHLILSETGSAEMDTLRSVSPMGVEAILSQMSEGILAPCTDQPLFVNLTEDGKRFSALEAYYLGKS